MSKKSSPQHSGEVLGGRSTIIGAVALLAISLVVFSPLVRSSIIVAGRTLRERIIFLHVVPPEPLAQPKHAVGASAAPPQRGTAPDSERDENLGGAVQQTSVSQKQASAADADSQALNLWAEFDSSVWGVSLEDWSKLHPDSSCKGSRGRAWGKIADREWSHRCSAGRGLEAAHWSFYMFGLQEPIVPRLEQFEAMSSEFPEETLALVQSSLQARLTARYGPGEDRSPKMGRIVSWPQYVLWNTADLEIQLNFSTLDSRTKQGRLQLQARHRALLDAAKDDERLNRLESSFIYGAGSTLGKQLARSLQSDFPDIATMLVKSQPDPDPQQMQEAVERFQSQLRAQAQQARVRAAGGQTAARAAVFAVPQRNWKAEEFHDALVRLLKSVETSAPDQRPILLLAADQLAGRLPVVIENDKSRNWDWSQWRSQLAGLGVTYSPGVESEWSYAGDVLKRVSVDYGDTVWGERAFISLLNQGWDPAEGCTAGTDQFRQVIQQALPFLEKHAHSPYRLDVQLAVAQAYETWWSLSQAAIPGQNAAETDEGSEPDADPREYQQGAEAARQQAITRYTQLLQSDPQSDYATYAARQLPRLKSGVDTGQRRFYCIVED